MPRGHLEGVAAVGRCGRVDDTAAADEISGALLFGFRSCTLGGEEPVSAARVDVLAVRVEDLRRRIDDKPCRVRGIELAALVERDIGFLLLTDLADDLV